MDHQYAANLRSDSDKIMIIAKTSAIPTIENCEKFNKPCKILLLKKMPYCELLLW